MICLSDKLSLKTDLSVADLKNRARFRFYSDIALFWRSDTGGEFSLLDGDMVISLSEDDDLAEVKAFIKMVSPRTAFLSKKDAERLSLSGEIALCVRFSGNPFKIKVPESDHLKSDEIYAILSETGLSLPDYPHFATDFCRRLLGGGLVYHAMQNKAVAVAVTEGDFALINGIASKKKGYGTLALLGVIQAAKKPNVLALCKADVMPFYIKNGFKPIDKYVYCTDIKEVMI